MGFPHCPHDIQDVIIPAFAEWTLSEEVAPLLWKHEENQKLSIEIYRQSVYLPIIHHKTIRKSVLTFRRVYVDSPPPQIGASQLVVYRKFFLDQLAAIFQAEVDQGQKVADHEFLCLEVIQLFKFLFAEAYETLEDETRNTLLHTLITTATQLLGPNPRNPELADSLAPVFLETILFIWIRTKTKDETHWNELQEGLGSLFHREDTVTVLKKTLLQLTMSICSVMYPPRLIKKTGASDKQVTGAFSSSNSAPQQKQTLPSRSPDYIPPPSLPAPDPAISQMQWSVDDLVYCWNQMLQIFNKVNAIKNPKIHASAIRTLNEIIHCILHAEENVPFEVASKRPLPKALELINTFGPWLLTACALKDQFVFGKADAYAGLCRLICRHTPAQLPLKFLAHFYSVIHLGLTQPSSGSSVQHMIILNSSNIFNLSLPGAHVLIPYYLMEIRKIFETGSAPHPVMLKGVLLLNSLIGQTRHLLGVTIPIDLENKLRTEFTREKALDFSHIHREVISLLRLLLKDSTVVLPELRVMSIWGLCVAIIAECEHPDEPTYSTFISETIPEISHFCRSDVREISRSALDALSCIASISFGPLNTHNPKVVEAVVECLCVNIVKGVLNDAILFRIPRAPLSPAPKIPRTLPHHPKHRLSKQLPSTFTV